LIVSGLVLLGIAAATYVVAQDHPLDRPCPLGTHSLHPTQIHFSPSLLQHQSWVGILPNEVGDGDIVVVCVDGLAIGRAFMDSEDLAAETVQLDIPTRWVDWNWASGSLNAYRDRARWTVVLPPFTEVASD